MARLAAGDLFHEGVGGGAVPQLLVDRPRIAIVDLDHADTSCVNCINYINTVKITQSYGSVKRKQRALPECLSLSIERPFIPA